jgi:lysophospholipase L1-like esterase
MTSTPVPSAPGGGGATTGSVRLVVVLTVAIVVGGLVLWRYVQPASDVAMLGDSIFHGAEETIQARYGDEWDMEFDAVPGATTTDQLAAAARLALRTEGRGQLVVGLGTNDVFQGVPLDESRRSMERILAEFPEVRCIHLVTVTDEQREVDPKVPWVEAEAYNDMLRGFERDPRVRIVEWAALLTANDSRTTGPLLRDNVHPNDRGNVALADLVAESLAGCED